MDKIVQGLRRRIEEVLDPLTSGSAGAVVALMDVPDHPNVGDQAIFLGELAYFREKMPSVELDIFTMTGPKPKDRKPDIIFIQGGGNFGDIWPRRHDVRLDAIEYHFDRRIVQFPQSIHFQQQDNLIRTQRAIERCRDFHFITRDEKAYEFARKNFACSVYLCPDMAFFMGPLTARQADLDVMCLLRTDKEVLKRKDAELDRALSKQGLTFRIADWLSENLIFAKANGALRPTSRLRRFTNPIARHSLPWREFYARRRLARGIGLLSHGKIVITDRLHGHIISTLLGRRQLVFDSLDGKIRAFNQTWLSHDRRTRFLEDMSDVSEALALPDAVVD